MFNCLETKYEKSTMKKRYFFTKKVWLLRNGSLKQPGRRNNKNSRE